MSTVLFAHDGYISSYKNRLYSDSYNDKIIDRYKNIADNIIFLVRVGEHKVNPNKTNEITSQNFTLVGIENFKSINYYWKYPNVKKIIECEVIKADYIIARIPSDLGFMAAKLARKHNKPYIVEVVGCPWDSYRNHSLIGKMVAPLYYLKQKRTLKISKWTIYVTTNFLQNRYPTRGKEISCSDVEINEFKRNIIDERIYKIKNSSIDQLVFGTIGSLNMKYKGYDTVIKTVSKLNNEGCSHKYLILGSGDSTWLESIISKYNAQSYVSIVSAVSHNEVFGWLDSLDVYLQPSKTEGMPRALIEAMSRGLPAIGTCVGGISELLENHYTIRKSHKRTEDLYNIVGNLSIRSLCEQAEMNYSNSEAFEIKKLELHRNNFYKDFKDNWR